MYLIWQNILLVGAAGAAGSVARYGLSELVNRLAGPGHPWGTLACNLLGCAAFGVVVALVESRVPLGDTARLLLLTGFLGAFTTFSTFAHEAGQFTRQGDWWVLAGHLLSHNLLGVVLLLAAFAVTRSWVAE